MTEVFFVNNSANSAGWHLVKNVFYFGHRSVAPVGLIYMYIYREGVCLFDIYVF